MKAKSRSWVRWLRRDALLAAFGFWLLALPAIAQEAQREFVPADSIARPELPSGPLIYIAYAFVWAAVLVYVLMLWRRIGRVERELAELHRKITRK